MNITILITETATALWEVNIRISAPKSELVGSISYNPPSKNKQLVMIFFAMLNSRFIVEFQQHVASEYHAVIWNAYSWYKHCNDENIHDWVRYSQRQLIV